MLCPEWLTDKIIHFADGATVKQKSHRNIKICTCMKILGLRLLLHPVMNVHVMALTE
jgi:hypothetical protein